MIPSQYVVLEEPPLTTSGKLDRNSLPTMEPVAPTQDFVAPRTEIEREVAQMWSEVIGVDDIGAETDFFDLGGHSLKMLQVAARIENEFGIRLPLASMFADSTVAGHALLLTEALVRRDLGDHDLASVLSDGGALD